ncbi:MAG: hypothetical protein A2Z34_10295 [Planctomycetes bacterium RBG_16_59_8]|nr:MAG: hypothetical protein A2Z34_10295 [Planctomycetes bacterium RBG_16_59_8]
MMNRSIAGVVIGLTCFFVFACRDMPSITDPESTLRQLKRRVEALLPVGWSASRAEGVLVVRRNDPVRMANMLNASAMESEKDILDRSFLCEYRITVRLGERLTAEELADMRHHNEEVSETIARLTEKMRHITHKFDDYLPTTPEDERLVKEYRDPQALYREIPRYHFNGFSAVVTSEPSEILQFSSPQEWQECNTVRAAVISCLKEYE